MQIDAISWSVVNVRRSVILIAVMVSLIVMVTLSFQGVSSATVYVMEVYPSTLVVHSYGLPLGPTQTFYVQWNATLNQTPNGQVTLMQVNYTINGTSHTASFVVTTSNGVYTMVDGAVLQDVTDYAQGITEGTWHTFKISVSTTSETSGYNLAVNFYIDGIELTGKSTTVYSSPIIDNSSAVTKLRSYLFIDAVTDSQGNIGPCDNGTPTYFTVVYGDASCVPKDSVPFFSSAFIGALVVLGVVLLFRRR